MVADSKKKSLLCVEAAMEKKALDPVLLEMRKTTSFTDYFFICTGRSDRQVLAIAEAVEEAMEKQGIRPLGQEGKPDGKWVLLDFEDVVVHIFLEPVREFYDLEGLWMDAPRINLEEGESFGGRSSGSKEGSR